MATTNTAFTWFWYIRKKGTRYYLGLVDDNGDDPAGAYTIDLYYDEVADDVTTQADLFPLPQQFETGFIKGVVAELMAMSSKEGLDFALRSQYIREYEDTIMEAIHYQVEESQQPLVMRPLDLRDD